MRPQDMNTTALAYMGDSVYEVLVRKHVLERENVHVDSIHKAAVKYVKASAQAGVARAFMAEEGFLSEAEAALMRRARNHKVSSKPKNADIIDYKLATAFEALVGYAYLAGDEKRLTELVEKAIKIIEEE